MSFSICCRGNDNKVLLGTLGIMRGEALTRASPLRYKFKMAMKKCFFRLNMNVLIRALINCGGR